MDKVDILRQKVKSMYDTRYEGCADWSDWMFDKHVSIVVSYGEDLSARFSANRDIVVGVCLVHDIADSVMSRSSDQHEARSIEIAEQLLTESGFSEDEKRVILKEILPNHSCKEGHSLISVEGKVMATADALAHFNTDFYFHAIYEYAQKGKSESEIKQWALRKLDKDFNNKIFFEEVKEETRANYEMLKQFFFA